MKTLKILADSEAEGYFMDLLKVTKDKKACRLGAIFGWNYNEYDISDEDFLRIKEHIKATKGL